MNADQVAKKLIFDVLVEKAITKVIAAIPFFGMPVINPIFVYAAEKLYSYLYDETEEEGTLLYIGIRTDHQRSKYQESVKELETATTQGQTDAQIKQAREEFKKRLKNFINLNPPS